MLCIGVKPVAGVPFEVYLGQDATVQDLKRSIADLGVEMPEAKQTILYAGRILGDALIVKEVGIREGTRVVVMASEKAPRLSSQPAAAGPVISAAAVAAETGEVVREIAGPAAEADAPPAVTRLAGRIPMWAAAEEVVSAEEVGPSPDGSIHVKAADVDHLCEMGFERGDVEHCLGLAFGDANRAAEYLMVGIPAHLQRASPLVAGTRFMTPDVGVLPAGATRAETLALDMEAVSANPTQNAESMRELLHGRGVATPAAPDSVGAMLAAAGDTRVRGGHGHAWEVRTDSGWQPWVPGVPFQGRAGEVVSFVLGRHSYSATFDGVGGEQLNLATGMRRRVRRVQGIRAAVQAPALVAAVQHCWRQQQHPVPGPCGREALPPVQTHEIEFVIPNCNTYSQGQSIRSPSLVAGDFKFRILVFPRGTASAQGKQVSAFVELDLSDGDYDEHWLYSKVQYQIAAVNWIDYRVSKVKNDLCDFSKDVMDRGWHDMLCVDDLSAEAGWLGPDGSLLFRVCVCCPFPRSIKINSDYSSKAQTGHVGLKASTQHLTHIDALLHSLVSLAELKNLVLPDTLVRDSGSAAKALQTLLCDLHTSSVAVSSDHLMRCLGWDHLPFVRDFDPRTLLRSFCEAVGQQLPQVRELFEGEQQTYIECCDVDCNSVRNEHFYGLHLNMQAADGRLLHNLEESMRELLAEEVLEGNNAYAADGHGLQRAKKGVRIKHLPRVLLLNLARMRVDPTTMKVRKMYKKFEFPLEVNLSAFVPGAGLYRLHAVIVHSGNTNHGEYHTHVRVSAQEGSQRWLTFNEKAVAPCSERAAVDANFGGEDVKVWNYFDLLPDEIGRAPLQCTCRSDCACALVYVRVGVDVPAESSSSGQPSCEFV